MLNIIQSRIYISASYLRPRMLKYWLLDMDVKPRFHEDEIRILRACSRRREYECYLKNNKSMRVSWFL
jgi:hypothetical protein